jgi:hypothetical protein
VNGQKMVSDFGLWKNFILEFMRNFCLTWLGITNIVDIPINTTRVSVTQISAGNDRYYLGKTWIISTFLFFLIWINFFL